MDCIAHGVAKSRTEESQKATFTFTFMFIATLFTLAKRWKQPKCPSRGEWINKSQCIHTMEYYSVIKKNNHVKVKVTQSLFETPWTIQSMKFSRPEYQSG